MIEVRNVTKRYGDVAVVDDVSLMVDRGGIVAIIGPNGAGKSTLLGMIGRLLPMTTGTIAVDGLDVTKTRSDILAKRISILRQENSITSRLTVRDLVAFGRYPHNKGRPTVEDRHRIDEAIAYLSLSDFADRFLDQLSGGQRQRAFVAMVLCQDTDYVLMDEPLNSLDMKNAVAMMKLMRRAADELGKTVIIVLHDINFASSYADTIVAMRDARIVHRGTPDEIMQSDVLRDIYDIDIDVHTLGPSRIGVFYR